MLIRDPVHGDIYLSSVETQVLDTPELQRLRGIKQLGTAYMVYPGCTHTRFEHSLGTMAVAKQILTVLAQSGLVITEETKQLITIGALLHDVTHIPFGHTFEDERKIFPRHDKGNRLNFFLRENGKLGQLLQRLGILSELRALLNGEITDWRAEIIASALDADLLDYLRRDAYMAGLAQTYDRRFFHHFRVVDDHLVLNIVKHNMDRPDIRSEVMHLLRLRYYLTERVYFHHTKVISGAMISKAVELGLDYGLEEHDLLQLSDYALFEHLKTLGNKACPSIVSLISAVERRRLLKRAYVLTNDSLSQGQRDHLIQKYHFGGRDRQLLEQEIMAAVGLSSADVIVYCPGAPNFREAAISVLSKDGPRKLNSPVPSPPEDIQQLEKQYQRLWRYYVFAPHNKLYEVQQYCQDKFGLPSEHYLSR